MSSIHLLKQQQGELLSIMAELAEALDACDNEIDESMIVECLGRLQRSMQRHTMLKPSHLYAILMSDGDPGMRQTAIQFRHDEDELWRQFDAFVSRWTVPGSIEARADLFRDEALGALAAIEDRGLREFELLYPVAERLQSTDVRHRRA